MDDQPGPRFLLLEDVAEELATSHAQVYAMVRRGELRALKLGGRGQWRVERSALEDYIARAYAETAAFLDATPFVESPPPKQRDAGSGGVDPGAEPSSDG